MLIIHHKKKRGVVNMNPVFIFLVLLAAFIVWWLLAFIFYPLGRFIYRIGKDAMNEINREDNKKKDEEEKQ